MCEEWVSDSCDSLWGFFPSVDWLVQVQCDDSLCYLTVFYFVKH